MPEAIQILIQHLAEFKSGSIEKDHPEYKQFERHLAVAWMQLEGGDEEGMRAYKIEDRLEDVTVEHPHTLTFWIERHGSVVLGSAFAQVHMWTLDLSERTARITGERKRKIGNTGRPLNTQQVVNELVVQILGRTDSELLLWKDPGRNTVQVLLRKAADADGAVSKATIDGRVKRWREALELALESHGWSPIKGMSHTFIDVSFARESAT